MNVTPGTWRNSPEGVVFTGHTRTSRSARDRSDVVNKARVSQVSHTHTLTQTLMVSTRHVPWPLGPFWKPPWCAQSLVPAPRTHASSPWKLYPNFCPGVLSPQPNPASISRPCKFGANPEVPPLATWLIQHWGPDPAQANETKELCWGTSGKEVPCRSGWGVQTSNLKPSRTQPKDEADTQGTGEQGPLGGPELQPDCPPTSGTEDNQLRFGEPTKPMFGHRVLA